jgi:CDGSH-type Zn-finger protein/uncharacterized Fe-S cluster protein YjdI
MSETVEQYRGKRIVVRFDGKRCIHSRHCVLDQPEVFRANVAGPWILPDAAEPERIVEVAHSCPSGAITYERTDGGPQEAAPAANVLRIRENGPLAFRAELRIAGEQAFRATLCRCGASQNRPYCDGSHAPAGFTATGEPAARVSEPLAARGGPVNVNPIANGPLEIMGNLEICSGTGRTLNRTQKTYLCRCGGSKNKPYCDGTHKTIGFQAPGGMKSAGSGPGSPPAKSGSSI